MKTNYDDNEKKKRIIWCPVCETEMINIFELVNHVQVDKCGMTVERLIAVGVLDEHELNN